jgi:cytochrome c oxidase cbb3-type subunit 3
MTPWGEVLGPEGVEQVIAYVRQLSGQEHDAALAAAGATQFMTFCAACHGPDGKGMAAVGAPNLTDDVWLYGGDLDTIRTTVVHGRMGQMPAFQDKLGEQRVRLLAAYVLKLSGGAQ